MSASLNLKSLQILKSLNLYSTTKFTLYSPSTPQILIYRDGVGDFFVGCFYCVELSGPFTNMRVVLSRLGLKNTRCVYLLW